MQMQMQMKKHFAPGRWEPLNQPYLIEMNDRWNLGLLYWFYLVDILDLELMLGLG